MHYGNNLFAILLGKKNTILFIALFIECFVL